MAQPNILFILADDLGWGDISLHNSPIRTPHIDHLAHEGIELTQHYVCPMCTPTRASLLSGRYPGRFGAHVTTPTNLPVFPDGYQTLPSVLRAAGYDTGLFGKWHLGSAPQFSPNHFGFNSSYGSLAGGVDPYTHCYKRGEYSVTWHRNGTLIEDRGHVTDLIAREAAEWITTRDRPWFCYVPYTAVHIPIKPPQEWMGRYDSGHYDKDPLKDLSFRKYAAYTSHMDHTIGQLMEALECTGQRENTIIIFSSDNGAINDSPLHATDKYPGWQESSPRLGSNAPFRGVKATLYEGGVRTPAIINWRGTLAPGKVDHAVSIADWMPTLLNQAGATLNEDPRYDGADIWGLIAGTDGPRERRFFWNFKGSRVLGVRQGDWKLISRETDGGRALELFNIARDPCEEQELSKEHPALVKDLADLIEEERQKDDSSVRPDINPQ